MHPYPTLDVPLSGLGEERDSSFMRGRIAILAWLPGAALVTLLAMLTGNWIVGVVGISLLLVGLWLFAARGSQVAAFIRRRFHNAP